MADTERIKRNLSKMIDQGAPEADLNTYLSSEGFSSPEHWRAHLKAPVTVDAIGRSLAKGATLGYADRFAAGMDALTGPAIDTGLKALNLGSTGTSTKPTLGERYDENLKSEQSQTQAFETAHPYIDTAATIGGGVAGAAAVLPSALTRPVAALGPVTRIGGNILKGGAVGGVLGGIAGSSTGDTLGERGSNALLGATFGGAIGAAAPAVGAVGQRAMETPWGRAVTENVFSPVVRKVGEAVGQVKNALTPPYLQGETVIGQKGSYTFTVPKSLSAAAPEGGQAPPLAGLADRTSNVAEEAAMQRLATLIQRSGQPPEFWQQQIEKRGAQAVLADLDPQFLDTATAVKKLPGDTKSSATITMESRNKGPGQRLRAPFEGDEPPPTDYALRGKGQAFDTHAQDVGATSYQGDMVAAGFKNSPGISEMIEKNKFVNKAIDDVMAIEKEARAGRPEVPPASPVEIMHKVKQKIWDMGFTGPNPKPGAEAPYYRDLGIDFVKKLKAANPELAAADKAYAEAKSLPEFYDAGAALFAKGTGERARETSAPALEDMFGRSTTPNQGLAARSGATNALRARTQTLTDARSAARQIADEAQSGTAGIQEKLIQLYGPKQAAQIINQAETEGIFANTSNRLLGGPKTADDLINAADVGGNLGIRMSGHSVRGQFIEHLSDIISRVVNPNMAVRNSLGRILINPDASENARYLARASDILARRRQGNALPSGVSGGGAQNVSE